MSKRREPDGCDGSGKTEMDSLGMASVYVEVEQDDGGGTETSRGPRAISDLDPRWMGRDLFPCPMNNSVIDFERKPKQAYFALKDVFTS